MRTRLLRNRRLTALLALLALTSAVLACSSVAALASSTSLVKVGDNFFNVKRLTVGKGARVTWKWTGGLNHNVTVKSGPSTFRSRTQAQGSYSHVFAKPGTYLLYCAIHPFMKMTVVVR
jgi:plastocyanin